jgi:mono/diheme cytochrome c family protein
MSLETNQPVSGVPGADESQSRGANVPIWLIIFTFLLLYWGAIYFDQNGAWFSAKVYSPYQSLEQVQELQPVSGESGAFEQGRAIYGRTCVACHQATALGTPGQFPPLAGSEWVNEPEPGRVIRAVLNGLQGPITVHGQAFNNTMVPWGPSLSDEEIAAVITYVRGNKEWSNHAPAVTPAQVKAIRDKLKAQSRMTPFTPEELLKIPPAE